MNHPEKTELKNCFNLFETMHFDISKWNKSQDFMQTFPTEAVIKINKFSWRILKGNALYFKVRKWSCS